MASCVTQLKCSFLGHVVSAPRILKMKWRLLQSKNLLFPLKLLRVILVSILTVSPNPFTRFFRPLTVRKITFQSLLRVLSRQTSLKGKLQRRCSRYTWWDHGWIQLRLKQFGSANIEPSTDNSEFNMFQVVTFCYIYICTNLRDINSTNYVSTFNIYIQEKHCVYIPKTSRLNNNNILFWE